MPKHVPAWTGAGCKKNRGVRDAGQFEQGVAVQSHDLPKILPARG